MSLEWSICIKSVFYEIKETVLKKTKNFPQLINGYSFHYYTVAHGWDNKGSATDFVENDWFATMKQTLRMETNLLPHIELMDKYDPENRFDPISET